MMLWRGAVVMLLLAGASLRAQTPASIRHTEADTRFMQGMITHHAQAVTMSALVAARTTRNDLHSLAQRIDVSQADEIRWMETWLGDRGESVRDTAAERTHAAMGHTPALMPGMLSPEEMTAIEGARGVTFERLFLAGMVKHHEGALRMVAALFATPGAGEEPMIFGFASDVDAGQRAEIARMRRLLEALSR